jgi:hypothetical protein
MFIPILAAYSVQLVGGIFAPSINSESCVPLWVFFAVFQPVVSLIVMIHGYAKLNLAFERDVDQDIVEMNIRLTYSESHVPNWLLQQMICLERLDGRALSLPYEIIPR